MLPWEIIDVVVVNQGNNKIALRVKLGGDGQVKYIGSFNRGGWLYTVDRLQNWEQFTFECLDGNKIALKSFHGKYIGATPNGNLYGTNKRQGWETWTFEAAPENQGTNLYPAQLNLIPVERKVFKLFSSI